jgi:D-tyrosyl-tRNA(Tyr) deacylase
MIGLLQRVSEASVTVDGEVIGTIGHGILVLLAVERSDTDAVAERLIERLLGYRVFEDAAGRMNHSVVEAAGGVLLVPQFTLAADTRRGMRPSFTPCAEPAEAERLFGYALACLQAQHPTVACGRFGADMRVALVNEGPVTFSLQVRSESSYACFP